MPFVVQEQCVKCKYADCVEVCPVECFYEGEEMLYVNPDECIDCDACAPACPVGAVVPEDAAEPHWIAKNANFDFTEDKRRSDKAAVTHGPDWDSSVS